MILCQLQGDDEGLLLTLTALAPHGVSVDGDLQVVTMDAVQRVAHGAVLEAVALDNLQQRSALTV